MSQTRSMALTRIVNSHEWSVCVLAQWQPLFHFSQLRQVPFKIPSFFSLGHSLLF
jgi:hypothetical protein